MKSLMKLVPILGLAVGFLGACAYDGHGRGGRAMETDYYGGYYDGAYGPFHDGYWGNDGAFWYSNDRNEWRRDDGHHFRRDRGGDNWQSVRGRGTHRDH